MTLNYSARTEAFFERANAIEQVRALAVAAIERVHVKGTPMCGATEVPVGSMLAQLAAETRYCTHLIGHDGPHECEGVSLRDPVHVPGFTEWCQTCHNPWPCPSVAALLALTPQTPQNPGRTYADPT